MHFKKATIFFLLIFSAILFYSISFVFNQPSILGYKFQNVNYVFIDLGANKGDSISNFLGINPSAQGGNIQSGFIHENYKGKKWIIYAFEANKFFDNNLTEVKEKAEELGHTVHLFKQTAAWIYDGKIEFYLDTVNKNNDFWGSSLKKNHVDVIRSNSTKTRIDCSDIARIIKLYDENDHIIVKMDIEGAEYDLLQDFIRKDAMKLIDYLAVEFHSFVSPFKIPEEVFVSLVKLFGVKFLSWSK